MKHKIVFFSTPSSRNSLFEEFLIHALQVREAIEKVSQSFKEDTDIINYSMRPLKEVRIDQGFPFKDYVEEEAESNYRHYLKYNRGRLNKTLLDKKKGIISNNRRNMLYSTNKRVTGENK